MNFNDRCEDTYNWVREANNQTRTYRQVCRKDEKGCGWKKGGRAHCRQNCTVQDEIGTSF